MSPEGTGAEAPPRPWWRRPAVWVGFVMSGAALATFAVLFDLGQVSSALLRLSPAHLAAAAVVFLTSYLVRSLRWQVLLRPVGRYPFGQTRDVLLIGFMVNNIVPARAGELARALVLGRVAGASRRGALATVGIERLFDGLVLIGMLVTVGLLFEVPGWIRHLAQVTVLVLALLTGLAAWFAFHHRSLLWSIDGLLRLLLLPERHRQRAVGFVARFVPGTLALRSPALTGAALGLSVGVWTLEVVVYHIMILGFGIDLPVWGTMVMLSATNFGIAVPSAPANLGVFEAACSGVLIGLGLDKELALSYAIGVHLMLFVCLTSAGLIAMWRMGLGLREVTARARPARRPPADP